MDYAIQLLLPILGGLMLGYWLTQQYGVPPIWTVILAILGMVGGIGILYKRFSYPELYNQKSANQAKPKQPSASKIAPETSQKSLPIEQLDFLYQDHSRHDASHPYQDDENETPPL